MNVGGATLCSGTQTSNASSRGKLRLAIARCGDVSRPYSWEECAANPNRHNLSPEEGTSWPTGEYCLALMLYSICLVDMTTNACPGRWFRIRRHPTQLLSLCTVWMRGAQTTLVRRMVSKDRSHIAQGEGQESVSPCAWQEGALSHGCVPHLHFLG